MRYFSLSFLVGSLFLHSCTVLPSQVTITIAALIACMCVLASCRRWSFSILLAGFLSGFFWSGWFAHQSMTRVLPHDSEGRVLKVKGIIDSLPVIDQFGTHFIFVTDEYSKIRLSWQRAEPLNVGDEYEFNVKLKRIHGMQNPGGFDYEAWALQNELHASGSVVVRLPYRFIRHHLFHAPVNQLRQWLQRRILKYLPNSPTSPWLLALMIGERSAAPAEHWQILRATGTNHLMAIAGLHIGLISGLIYTLVQFLWRRSVTLVSMYPAQLAASLASLMMAWTYSMLAGFSIPTQRACMMVTFFLCALLARRQLPAWHAWSAALCVVMLLDPYAVLSESFWLSFGTLALIAYGMHGRLRPGGWWWKWGRVQWVIGVGLIPLSLLFFQQTSLVSVAANCLAIPWLGFLVLPFCLLSTIFLLFAPSLGGIFLWVADINLAGLWKLLEWFAHLDFAVWNAAIISPVIFIATLIACLLALMPAGMPGRWLVCVWILPVIYIHPASLQQNNFRVTTLDVGQGLSVVVQTRHHTLVYDTGPKFGSQFDMGESVVLPFLRSAGIKKIDAMVISHGDNDHIGGAATVIANIPTSSILTSAVAKFTTQPAALCLAGMRWEWDGVEFSMLYPFQASLTLGNDSSCVLRISNKHHSVLLTGDIEKFAERQLLSQSHDLLKSDLMTAPHHGSKTSSQAEFIHAVMPQYVIYATGYRNRYRFPHQRVVSDYNAADVLQLNTMESGAIQFEMEEEAAVIKPKQYRYLRQRYWHDV